MVIETTGVVIIDGNKVLLTKHKEEAEHLTGVYGIPAGRIEEGETLIQAAIREVAEEVGLKIREEDLMPIDKTYEAKIEREDGKTKEFSLDAFVCNKYEGSPEESNETIPEWVEISKLNEYKLLPNMEAVIKEGFSELSK